MQNTNALDETHWVWAAFDALNARHFYGRLERPQQILRSRFSSWSAAAVNTSAGGVPCRLIWLDDAVVDADPATASDSLLHEMIHYELAATADGDGDQSHGTRFVRRADEIGHVLGLLPCAMPGVPAEQIAKIASVWPKVQREASKLQG